jgi:hypothetical protein
MNTVATALSPFVKHTIKVTLWSTFAASGVLLILLAPMWTCGSACRTRALQAPLAEDRVAAFMATHGPDASFSAKETLELQVGALGSNAALGDDFGIRYAYALASDDNRAATGPYDRFAMMVKTSYAPLLDFKTVEIEKLGGCSTGETFLVHVTDDDDIMTTYAWSLSPRSSDGAWATDSVLEVDPRFTWEH